MKTLILLVHLHLVLAFAQHHPPIFNKWTSPNRKPSPALSKRSVSYQPEFGACEDGQETCSDACGDGFKECGAGTSAAVFCYNPRAGETCCGDDGGTACDNGFYCASRGDGAACCPGSLSLSECEDELKVELSSINPPESSSKKQDPPGKEPTPEPEPPVQRSSTSTPVHESTTSDKDERSSTAEAEGTTTITKSSTTTVIITVPFPSSSSSAPPSSSPRPASAEPLVSVPPSTSPLPTLSSPSPVSNLTSVESLPFTPSFTDTTTSPIDNTGPPKTPKPIPPTNETSATRAAGVPILLPTALDSPSCDLTCDEESGGEVEMCFTKTVTERVTITLQDDSNGCERVTTLTPTITLTALENLTLECPASHQKDATHCVSVDIPGAIATQGADEKPTETVHECDELPENAATDASDELLGGVATQRADEQLNTTVQDSDELPENTTARGPDDIPDDIATQRVDEKPEATANESEELPGDATTPSDPDTTEHRATEGAILPSTANGDGEDGEGEGGEATPSTTLMPSTLSTVPADAPPAFETAAGSRSAHRVSACIVLLALMGLGVGM